MAEKKYTVKKFCKEYTDAKADQTKEALMKSVVNKNYIPYEMKTAVCENIIKSTYYQTVERNGMNIKKLHVNSPAQYMLYYLNLIAHYTTIDVDFKQSLEEFNLLNKSGVLDVILDYLPEREVKEFRMILDMVEKDTLQNEYETHAFIANQVERFGQLTSGILKPILERGLTALENIDEKTIDKFFKQVQKLNVNNIKDKINIVK